MFNFNLMTCEDTNQIAHNKRTVISFISCIEIIINHTSYFIKIFFFIILEHKTFFILSGELHSPRIVAGRWSCGEYTGNLALLLSYLSLKGQCAEYFPILRKLQVSPPSRRTNEGKPARSNRAEPVNRVTARFRCWFPFTVAACMCARDLSIGASRTQAATHLRSLHRCTSPYWRGCEGEDCSLHLTRAHLSRQASVKVRIFLMRSIVVTRKFANLHFWFFQCVIR